MTAETEPTVADNADRERYEISADGRVAGFATYRTEPGRITLVHTEIDSDFTGQGLGNALVQGALDDVRRQGRSVVPDCPFVADFIASHPGYADLVDESNR